MWGQLSPVSCYQYQYMQQYYYSTTRSYSLERILRRRRSRSLDAPPILPLREESRFYTAALGSLIAASRVVVSNVLLRVSVVVLVVVVPSSVLSSVVLYWFNYSAAPIVVILNIHFQDFQRHSGILGAMTSWLLQRQKEFNREKNYGV